MGVWIDGNQADNAVVSVFDTGFTRGDGIFEALRVYGGRAFAVDDHVMRLQRSAEALELDLPDAADIVGWIKAAAATQDEGVIRVIATRGGPDVGVAPPVVLVMTEPLPPVLNEVRLLPLGAPWHAAGRPWDLAGAKTLSYGPNVNASRVARSAGYDDALLLSDAGIVLEGPTFSVGWVVDGRVETPSLDLFILDSITRRYVLDLVGAYIEGRYPLDRLGQASEVFAISTVKEVTPVVQVGDLAFDPGPVTQQLAEQFRAMLADRGLVGR